MSSNRAFRPYDPFLGTAAREKAVRCRISPDGLEVPVPRPSATGTIRYPWDALALGDYFLAPIGSRSPRAMIAGFRQAAARRDYEISVTRIDDPRAGGVFRVCLSAIGVRAAIQRAYERGLLHYPPAAARSISCKNPQGRRMARAMQKERDRLREEALRSAPESSPAISVPPSASPAFPTPLLGPDYDSLSAEDKRLRAIQRALEETN